MLFCIYSSHFSDVLLIKRVIVLCKKSY